MTDAAVVTAIYGGYDTLKIPPQQDVDVEWVCVTDDPNLDGGGVWKIHHAPRSPEVGPRLAAKLPKCRPWLYTEDAEANASVPIIWMDASFTVKHAGSIRGLVEATASGRGAVWQFVHPNRSCIYTEAAFSKVLPKYEHQPIVEQAAHYETQGHPHDWGLWATGLIVYPRWTLHGITTVWLLEQLRWTNQDQVSQAYVWRSHGVRPRELPGHLLQNDYVELHPHLDGT